MRCVRPFLQLGGIVDVLILYTAILLAFTGQFEESKEGGADDDDGDEEASKDADGGDYSEEDEVGRRRASATLRVVGPRSCCRDMDHWVCLLSKFRVVAVCALCPCSACGRA